MKRILTVLLFSFIATFSFAATSNETTNNEITNKTETTHPSGSGTITDACGNTYEITWYCNYNCGGLDVIDAIMEWGDDNTDCGFSSYTAD